MQNPYDEGYIEWDEDPKALHSSILVRPIMSEEEAKLWGSEKTESGLFIADNAREVESKRAVLSSEMAIVVKVGKNAYPVELYDEPEVDINDVIIMIPNSGTRWTDHKAGIEYRTIRSGDINLKVGKWRQKK